MKKQKGSNPKRDLTMKRFGWVVLGIQALFSALSIYAIIDANVLPTRYLLIAMGVIVLLLILMGLWVMKTKGFASRIISLILSIAILLGTIYVMNASGFIGRVTGGNKNTHVINVLVLDESPAKNISDVKDEQFGVNTQQEQETANRAVTLIKEKDNIDISIKSYSDYETMIDDLYDGTVKVIIMSEGNMSLMDEIDENFTSNVRIIASYKYEEEVVQRDTRPDVLKETYSIFLSGIDTYGPVSTVSRSDVNMIITVNPKTNQILLTSIPRDYFVTLASRGAKDKLTHAGLYGVEESMNTLENLLNIDIDFYVRVNFSSVTDIVNALGGVEVYTKYNFVTLHGGYRFTAGNNSVNGAQALSFVRERYNLPNGDNDRVYHQQQLVQGILNKAMSPSIITRFSSVLNSVSGSLQMSFSESELTSIIRHQVDSMESWDIQQVQLTGTGSSGVTYSMPGRNLYIMIPNQDSVNRASSLIHQMEKGEVISVD